MTARYRCPFCGSYALEDHLKMQKHMGDHHADKLFKLLRKVGYKVIESFSTRKEAIAP